MLPAASGSQQNCNSSLYLEALIRRLESLSLQNQAYIRTQTVRQNRLPIPKKAVIINRCRESAQCAPPSSLRDVFKLSALSLFVYGVLTVAPLVSPQMFGHPLISTSSPTCLWMLLFTQ